MEKIENNKTKDLAYKVENNTMQGACTQLEKLNYQLENLTAWNIQSDEDLIDLILRLYVIAIGDIQLSYTSKEQKTYVYQTVKHIVKENKDKMKCIKIAEKKLYPVKFDLEKFLNKKIDDIIIN